MLPRCSMLTSLSMSFSRPILLNSPSSFNDLRLCGRFAHFTGLKSFESYCRYVSTPRDLPSLADPPTNLHIVNLHTFRGNLPPFIVAIEKLSTLDHITLPRQWLACSATQSSCKTDRCKYYCDTILTRDLTQIRTS